MAQNPAGAPTQSDPEVLKKPEIVAAFSWQTVLELFCRRGTLLATGYERARLPLYSGQEGQLNDGSRQGP